MAYTDYEPEDFLADETFLAWQRRTDATAQSFWEQWQAEHPERRGVVEEAIMLLTLLNAERLNVPPEQVARAEVRFWEQADRQPIQTRQPIFFPWRWVAAACVSLIILAGAGWWYTQRPVEVSTAFGETRTFRLPDGSNVTLNAHSTLQYPRQWETGQARQVWLTGEAYFSITHTTTHQPFTVHAPLGVDVRVLGTQFTVTERSDKVRVVLQSGAVQLQTSATAQRPAEQLRMQPGDLVDVSRQTSALVRRQVRAEIYSSWRSDKLLLDKTPLREIIDRLEATYGWNIAVSDPQLLDQKLTGSLPLGEETALLRQLADVLDVRVHRQGALIRLDSTADSIAP